MLVHQKQATSYLRSKIQQSVHLEWDQLGVVGHHLVGRQRVTLLLRRPQHLHRRHLKHSTRPLHSAFVCEVHWVFLTLPTGRNRRYRIRFGRHGGDRQTRCHAWGTCDCRSPPMSDSAALRSALLSTLGSCTSPTPTADCSALSKLEPRHPYSVLRNVWDGTLNAFCSDMRPTIRQN